MIARSSSKPDIRIEVPVALQVDNFTPLARTPWAGSKIAGELKLRLPLNNANQRVGESWEYSLGPEFTSFCPDFALGLPEFLSNFKQQVFPEGQSSESALRLLVKIIDTAAPLSFQIHPADDDAFLNRDECGKPESWYIIDAEKGAGIYLGFVQPMHKSVLENILRTGTREDVLACMQFVPVTKHDYFEIPPHVPHAIGAGITLLEPQRVLPGKKGKTYRLWDWQRKYDDRGEYNDEQGQERELHLSESLRLLEPASQSGAEFIARIKKDPDTQVLMDAVRHDAYPANGNYRLHRIACLGAVPAPVELDLQGIAVATILGDAVWEKEGKKCKLHQGQSYLFPGSLFGCKLHLERHSELLLVIPEPGQLSVWS